MEKTKVYCNHNFQIASATSLMGMMMVAIIVPAFPKTIEALGISEQSVGLLITAYTFPSFVLTPLGGIIADRLGRKKVLVTSLFLFGIFGGACTFAPDFNTLLILRVLQGLGSAPVISVAVAVIGDIFHGHQRAEAMALNMTIMYVGYIVYPVVGGALAGLAWNFTFLPFLLAIPLGLIALAFLHCPEPESTKSLKDYLLGSLHYIKSLKTLWLFSAAVITYILLYGTYLVYFSLLLGRRFHASPVTIGLFIATVGLLTAISASQLGRFSQRFSLVTLLTGSFVLYAVSMIIIPAMSNIWLCLLPTILFGMAHGTNLATQNIVAAGVTTLEHRGGFMALHTTMIILGMTIGPPLMGLAFNLTSLNTTFIVAAVIAFIIPVMSITIGRDRLAVTQSH